VLFAHPATRRDKVEFARLTPSDPLYAAAVAHLPGEPPAALWGRRTLYRYTGKPLLVNEIFLPGLIG
jgi:chorismate--pyruvate lyase